MPQHESAVYHLDLSGRIPPGRLVSVEEQPGGLADIYMHPLHVRQPLLWELNWLTRHQVGYGLWRQKWDHSGRTRQPAQGLSVAASSWEIVPSAELPKGCHVFPLEEDGSCVWLIRSGYCTATFVNEMNRLLDRIAGDGLWLQDWSNHGPGTRQERPAALAPLLEPHLSA